ncbi:MAG: VWA-like domain-containing protein [Verrucomicrobiota bacterium]
MSTEEATLRLEGSLVRLRARQPFFGALALFIDHHLDEAIPTACTNGKWIRFNPQFVCSINARELDGVMVHEILHAALRHSSRCGQRDPEQWNIAADIVINGMVREIKDLELPFSPIEDFRLKDLEVEEAYDRLSTYSKPYTLSAEWHDLVRTRSNHDGAGIDDASEEREQRTFWASAFSRARMLTGEDAFGQLPAGLLRAVDEALEPSLDWRTLLWRFLASSQVDFDGFDRRFIGSGLYLEDLQGESLKVRVCIDTSGSISPQDLGKFMAELRGIVASYPHLDLLIYYADTELHGPYDLEDQEALLPKGGGGTDFRPFFKEMEHPDHDDALLVYFTDGYGSIPDRAPEQELLWVLESGSMVRSPCGFGEVCWIR